MKAIVAGPTGLVGLELVKGLLVDPEFTSVTVFSRRPLSITDEKLVTVIGELGQLASHSQELKGDVYFSCLGTTIKTAGSQDNFRKVDYHGVVSLGRIAFTHKAKKLIVVSASGADANSKIFYSRVKGETEKALKDLGLHSLVILRPGLLLGDREEKRTAEKMSIRAFSVFRHIVPEKVSRSLGTDVKLLVQRMIREAKSESPGLHIIEAKDI
jgi:uncharacterized protein YbjT (DUF2867 family)